MQFNAPCTTGMCHFIINVLIFHLRAFSGFIFVFLCVLQAVCLAACKKLHEMGAFTDMLLPDKGSGEEREKTDQNLEEDPLSGTARHREFYPEGVADVLKVSLSCLFNALDWLRVIF